ncbi:seven in absentia homolog 3 [Pelobates fuscus]|uniref:seven in absentia homolog 3 n=1 Tax=Pelobates fuscus TaxID=191477 RepID=UPI002FE4EF48
MLFFTQCFGAVLDLIHLRFQHYQAKRVFSTAGQLVCVVNPTLNSKHGSSRCAPSRDSTPPATQHHCQEVFFDAKLTSCSCPLYSCKWEGHLEVVISHLTQTHTINILQGAEIVFLATDMNLPAPVDWIIAHSCLGHHFLLVLRKQEKYQGSPQFFATMMLIGTPAQADNFNYKLELNRNRRRLTWESTPRSVLDCVDSGITDGDCLVLNASVAQLFSDNGNLAIGIAITTNTLCSLETKM